MKIFNQNDKITIQDIKEFENNYKSFLPYQYKDFMLTFNGGEISPNTFSKYGIEYDLLFFNSLEEIINLFEGEYNLIPKKSIPIAIIDGNDWIFISTDKSNNGQIFLGDSNTSIENSLDELILLSDSFNEFLDMFV